MNSLEQEPTPDMQAATQTMDRLASVIGENIVLASEIDRQVLVGAVCLQSAVLLEGEPGTGKTVLSKTIAKAIGGKFKRIQGTPDLLPSAITGSEYFHYGKGEYMFRPGPIFTNVLLVDEINRLSEKTQAGLIQGMEERYVTVDGEDYNLEDPFMVLATENPNEENQGTYRLNLANIDRFAMTFWLPTFGAQKMAEISKIKPNLHTVVEPQEITNATAAIESATAADDIRERAGKIVEVLRSIDFVEPGASILGQRATNEIIRQAKARVVSRSLTTVAKSDIDTVAPYVLAHRLGLTFDAEDKKIDKYEVIDTAIKAIK